MTRVVKFPAEVGNRLFSLPPHPDWLWGPLSLLFNRDWGVKQLGHETDHSPPSNTKLKNVWSYTPLPSSWCDALVSIVCSQDVVLS